MTVFFPLDTAKSRLQGKLEVVCFLFLNCCFDVLVVFTFRPCLTQYYNKGGLALIDRYYLIVIQIYKYTVVVEPEMC